jgi:alpha-tubulin suppressor-like RCC1 family protein
VNLPVSVSGTVDTNTPGVYLLTYSATNALGAVGTATRTVVVADTRLPVLTLLGDNPLLHAVGTPFTDPGATATDLCAGDLTSSIGITDTVNASLPGNYTNTYTVTDFSGNTAQITRTILVVEVPLATTLPASGLLNNAATLNGTVNPKGVATTAWFEWGSGLGYANTTPPVAVGSGTAPVSVGAGLTGLTPGVTYHYRVVASNSLGVTRSAARTFWSPAIVLDGPDPLTNECHVAFEDPGAKVSAWPIALAAGSYHSLALSADGTVVGWGRNDFGQTNIPASATNVEALAAGGWHNLALRGDGTVVGWGYNGSGQTNIPASATNVMALAAGLYHSLALKGDGTVVGWGNNSSGQTNIPATATNVVALAAGHLHNLALRGDGTVVAWGNNSFGQTTIPDSATNVVALAAGESHCLALRGDGTVVGWGRNNYGQTIIPASATNVVAIAAGYFHNLALRADGTVVGWGNNGNGQTNIPTHVTNVVALAAGESHSLALKADGTVVGWGRNDYGQTNIPADLDTLDLPVSVSSTLDPNTPGVYLLTYSATNALGAVGTTTRTVVVTDTRPPVLTLLGNNPLLHELGAPFTDPGATATDLCAGDLTGSIVSNLTVNPNVAGFYTNTYTVTDFSGNTVQITRSIQVGVPPLVTTLPASGMLNDAATLNGTVNPSGVPSGVATTAWFEWDSTLSFANTTPRVAAGSGTAPVSLSAGLTGLTPGVIYHYRVVASNSVWVIRGAAQTFWSPAMVLNSPNPLTNECHVAFADPTAVNASPIALAAGHSHSLALRADGTVVGWGENSRGQTTIPATATNVVTLAGGFNHSLALKGDGTVIGWGGNDYGQTTIPASATNVVAIAADGLYGLALKGDGTVVAWGRNDFGQTTIPASATNVVAIAAGYYHSLALKCDGTVVAWGYNDYGQTTIPASATNVVAVAAGFLHSLALKGDGTIVGWGRNDRGQTTIPASATNVVAIAAGDYHSLALKGDGTVVGWGWNDYGLTTIPASAANAVAIAAGGVHSLALKGDGTVIGWGLNDSGQTNVPASVYQLNAPLSVSGTVDTNALGVYLLTYSATNALGAVGTATRTVVVADSLPPVLALLGDNPLLHTVGAPFTDPGATATDLCAGDLTGSIAITNTVNITMPGSYTNTYTVTDASGNTAQITRSILVGVPLATTLPASDMFNDAATLNGTVNPMGVATTAWFEWGSGLGYANTTPPVAVASGTAPVPLSAGLTGLTPGVTYHYRVVASNSVWITRGATQTFWSPAIALNGPNPLTNECHMAFVDHGAKVSTLPIALAAGYLHSLVLRRDGTIVGWGYNNNGQTNIPASATDVVALAAGYSHSLALKSDGTVIGWGAGGSGTSGDPNYGQTTIPASATNVVALAAGWYHSLALRADGTVVGWGRNDYGQATIPASATNVVALAAGYRHSLALKGDGTVVGWGDNSYSQATIPASATNVVALAAGWYHGLALRGDGTVVGWGDNYFGQTNIPASATNVVALAAGYRHCLALKGDGTVVGWGINWFGQTNIPAGATNVVAIAAGDGHSLGLKGDGTIVGWGGNDYGQTNIPASVYQLNLAPSVNGTVDTNTPGVYLLTYSATNALGAVGTATRTVVVTDTQPPVLTLLGSNPLLHALGASFTDPGATATDLCAGDLTGSIVITNTVNSGLLGSYTNTYTVTDASGNTAQTNRVVTVFLPPQPVLTGCSVPAPGQFRLQATGMAGLTYTLQISTNLVNWVNCTNLVAGPGGLIQCLVQRPASGPVCFFRLRWPADPTLSRPTLLGLARQSNGRLRLQATGAADLTYTLQTSTNLVNWVNHTNVVASPGGTIDCLMDIGPNAPAGFYRLRWP